MRPPTASGLFRWDGMRDLAGFQPLVEEIEGGGGVEGAAGDPHDQTGELLVLGRAEAGGGEAEGGVGRVPGAGREGHQRAKRAADQGGEEQAEGGEAVAGAAAMGDGPPE